MQAFNSELFMTTSEVADLLGVHSSTVKRWTDAAELASQKTDGGHRRIYLQSVLEFARARDVGTFLDAFEPFESHVWLAARDAIRHDDFKRTVTLAMGWLVRGHPKRITALFHELGSRADLPFSVLCDRAIQPFMAEVGTLWREGRLRIGEEHMASQAVLEALIHLSARRDTTAPMVRSEDRRRAIVGAMAGDQHHLGAMCVRILLERNGWDVQYLGADTPAEEFAAMQRSREAELVCVSFSPPASVAHMRRCLDVMSEFYRSEVPYHLAFGGLSSPLIEAEAVNGPWETFQIHPSAEAFERWLNGGVSGVKTEAWRESA
jgi:excisionase family DNA binding protein